MYDGLIAVRVDDHSGRTETTLAERVTLANAIDAIAQKAGLKLRQSPAAESVTGVRYKGIADAPEYARHAIGELMACGALNGTGSEKGIDLDLDALRVLTIVMRYAKFLHSLEPEQEELGE